ncbi:MAG TPA: alpha/beta hydrolase [Steroidobacteraceae bacterium]|nr:alpha/beta hydrolase [Steroidobacteraceae bacterium]
MKDSTTRRVLLGAALVAVPLSAVLSSAETRANMPATARKRGYVDGPFGLVHYYDTGPTGRPLVLFHQAPMSARQFDAVYLPLARRGIRAIGVDLPGFGMSDPTDFVPKVEDWARIVPPLLDALGIEQADLLGHHTGALLATEVALQFPDRIRNLIVNGPFPITAARRAELLQKLQVDEIDFEYKADGSHLAESFRRRFEMYGPGADPKLTTRVVVEKFQGLGPFWYGHNAAYRYDHAAALAKLRHRTLIFTNTTDMIYDLAQRARELRPDFAYAELEGGGVDIMDQQPEAWSETVARFLGTVPAIAQ